jgi:hypothetical protein
LLPKKFTYITYNFSGTPLGAGNIYPLVFSKPIISGLGTEYMQANKDLIEKVYEKTAEDKAIDIATQGNASASSTEINNTAALAIDTNFNTRWASEVGIPQWFEIEWPQKQEISAIKIFFENAYANNYVIQTWSDMNWTTQLEIKDNEALETTHMFNQSVNTTKLRVEFTEAKPFNQVSIHQIEVYSTQSSIPKILGVLGIKNLIMEKNIVTGSFFDVNSLALLTSEIILVKDWNEISLYENTYSIEKIYPANTIQTFSDYEEMFKITENTDWSILQQTAFINSSTNIDRNLLKSLQLPEEFSWQEISPTKYTIKTKTNQPFILGLMESYNPNWKVHVNNNLISENNHIKINAYANGWIIKDTGDLTITIEYKVQEVFALAITASIILPILLLAFLCRKDIKKTSALIYKMTKKT